LNKISDLKFSLLRWITRKQSARKHAHGFVMDEQHVCRACMNPLSGWSLKGSLEENDVIVCNTCGRSGRFSSRFGLVPMTNDEIIALFLEIPLQDWLKMHELEYKIRQERQHSK
jgi:hypothetical protein